MCINKLIEKLATENTENAASPQALSPRSLLGSGLALVVTFIIVMVVSIGPREDITERITELNFLFELLVASTSLVFALWSGSQSFYPDLSLKKSVRRLPIIGLVMFVLLMTFKLSYFLMHMDMQSVKGLGCFMEQCILSAIPATLLFALLTRGFCMNTKLSAFAGGIVASMTSYITMRLVEANEDMVHLFLFHVGSAALMMFTYTAIGNYWLKRKQ